MSRVHREFVELAAARLDGALAPASEARLAAHLASCSPCRERAAAYEVDRAALQALRQPAPPRDLWSRTAAALDREAARPARWPGILGSRRAGGAAARRPTRGAVAAFVAILVIGAVISSTLFPGLTAPGGEPTVASATPFAIQPSVLAYVSTRAGEVGVYMGQIDRVCPEGAVTTCQPVDPEVRKVASFRSDFVPQRLAISPDGRSAAVVGTAAGSGVVYTLAFPDLAGPTPEPTEIASSEPSQPTEGPPGPGATPTSPAVRPSGSPGEPAAIIDHVIVVGEAPAYSADGTMLAFSAMPADGSTGPDIYLWHVGEETAVRLTDDHGSIFASWAGSLVVGSRAGEALEGAPDQTDAVAPRSFLLDPATGEQRDLALAAWRPIVDPTGRFVIYWDGALAPSKDGRTWQEHRGGLYLARWSRFDPAAVETPEPTEQPEATTPPSPGTTGEPDATGEASPTGPPSATPSATDEPTDGAPGAPEVSTPPGSPKAPPPAESTAPAASPDAGEPVPLQADRDYETDPVLWWEVRWSPDGEWFGAWIGDATSGETPPSGPTTGRLTVGAVDRTTGRIDPLRTQLDGAPAVRGFDLGDHRIAWATLPDEKGASEVRLLVWTAEDRGLVRTTPRGGSDILPAL